MSENAVTATDFGVTGGSALDAEGVSVRYGIVEAVRDVSISVRPNAITAILGANGAGKTSLLSALSGVVRPSAGQVRLDGRDVTTARVWSKVRQGLVHVPEGRHIIAPLTIEENLQLGGFVRSGTERRQTVETVYETFPILHERRRSAGGLLSGGEQQMLAFGRALMARPKVLLLDEPSMGLAPIMVDVILEGVQRMAERGIAILMVEQNATAALDISSYAYVLEQGSVVLSGLSSDIANHAGVVEAYLGMSTDGGEQQ